MIDFVGKVSKKLLQLAVVLRCNIIDHHREQFQNLLVLGKFTTPGKSVHIGKVNLYLFAECAELIAVLVVKVVFVHIRNIGQIDFCSNAIFIIVDRLNRCVNQLFNPAECKIKGIDGAFHTFHKVYSHKAANTKLTACLGEANVYLIVTVQFRILFHTAWQNVVRRTVNIQVQLC